LLLSLAADFLDKRKQSLSETVSKKIYNEIESYKFSSMPVEESQRTIEQMLDFIIRQLRENRNHAPAAYEAIKDLVAYEEGIASRRVKYQISLVDLLHGIRIFRDLLWEDLQRKFGTKEFKGEEFFTLEKRINPFIYIFSVRVSEAYLNSKDEVIESQQKALLKWEEVVKSVSSIELKIPCREEFAIIGRMQAEAIARRLNFDEEEVQDIKSAVGEAVDNAIEHGISEKGIDLHYHLSRRELIIEIIDYGRGFNPDGVGFELPDPMAERGRGLFILRQLVDDLRIESNGNEGTKVIMSKKRVFK